MHLGRGRARASMIHMEFSEWPGLIAVILLVRGVHYPVRVYGHHYVTK